MGHATLSASSRSALESLAGDLHRVFGNRLYSVCAYGRIAPAEAELQSIALVDRLAFDDLAACVPLVRRWTNLDLAVPLILERDEFARTLDVFPLEYGEIIATHVHIYGDDPFEGLSVSAEDLRRGIELQAKSHLIHLREGFLESGGDPRAVARLIGASAQGYGRLLTNLVALVSPGVADLDDGEIAAATEGQTGISAELTKEVLSSKNGAPSTIADPTALLARYIGAVEQLWEYVDAWKRA